jgi:Reverse transcriptase (RNA-dependent DNA polymerase)
LKQINYYQTFRQPNPGESLEAFRKIPYHLVFDVKLYLRKKARLVAGGHKTAPPKEDMYSGVVDLFMVRLGHMIAAANQLKVCAANISNVFLYGTTKEQVYIIAGSKFGSLAGKPLIIDRCLYGLKISSARFHEHLSAKLRSMGYRPIKADTDFWIKDCGQHYEYIATYVDDVLVYLKDPMKIIEELQRDYILKGIGVPRY